MYYFTTRVELHKSTTEKEYNTLHNEMAKEGFWRTIQLSNETDIYHLPTAEYNYHHATKTALQVLEMTKTAAARTGLEFSVLVTKSDERRQWYNLELVK